MCERPSPCCPMRGHCPPSVERKRLRSSRPYRTAGIECPGCRRRVLVLYGITTELWHQALGCQRCLPVVSYRRTVTAISGTSTSSSPNDDCGTSRPGLRGAFETRAQLTQERTSLQWAIGLWETPCGPDPPKAVANESAAKLPGALVRSHRSATVPIVARATNGDLTVAFVRKCGNSYALIESYREGGKVKQRYVRTLTPAEAEVIRGPGCSPSWTTGDDTSMRRGGFATGTQSWGFWSGWYDEHTTWATMVASQSKPRCDTWDVVSMASARVIPGRMMISRRPASW